MRRSIRNKSRHTFHSTREVYSLCINDDIPFLLFLIIEVPSFFWIEEFFLHIIHTVFTSNQIFMESKSKDRIYFWCYCSAHSLMKHIDMSITSEEMKWAIVRNLLFELSFCEYSWEFYILSDTISYKVNDIGSSSIFFNHTVSNSDNEVSNLYIPGDVGKTI